MEFSVGTALVGDRTVVTVTGELDAHSAPALMTELDARSRQSGVGLVVDLSQVDFIDSTGLGVLVTALKQVREAGGALDVVVSASRVRKVFTLTGLDAVIPLHATLAEALQAR